MYVLLCRSKSLADSFVDLYRQHDLLRSPRLLCYHSFQYLATPLPNQHSPRVLLVAAVEVEGLDCVSSLVL